MMTKRLTVSELDAITAKVSELDTPNSVDGSLVEQVEHLTAVLALIHPRTAHGLRVRYTDVYTALDEDSEPAEVRLRDLRDQELIPTLTRSAPHDYYFGPDEDDNFFGFYQMREHLVYGSPGGASLLFIPRDDALEGARLQWALHRARTWRGFKQMAGEARFEEAMERAECDVPDMCAPFYPDAIKGYEDGGWPNWYAQEMLYWMPESVQEQFGQMDEARFDGYFLSLRLDSEAEIVAALEQHGYRCTRDDVLVNKATGYYTFTK